MHKRGIKEKSIFFNSFDCSSGLSRIVSPALSEISSLLLLRSEAREKPQKQARYGSKVRMHTGRLRVSRPHLGRYRLHVSASAYVEFQKHEVQGSSPSPFRQSHLSTVDLPAFSSHVRQQEVGRSAQEIQE